jgi:hypothetical protein
VGILQTKKSLQYSGEIFGQKAYDEQQYTFPFSCSLLLFQNDKITLKFKMLSSGVENKSMSEAVKAVDSTQIVRSAEVRESEVGLS